MTRLSRNCTNGKTYHIDHLPIQIESTNPFLHMFLVALHDLRSSLNIWTRSTTMKHVMNKFMNRSGLLTLF